MPVVGALDAPAIEMRSMSRTLEKTKQRSALVQCRRWKRPANRSGLGQCHFKESCGK